MKKLISSLVLLATSAVGLASCGSSLPNLEGQSFDVVYARCSKNENFKSLEKIEFVKEENATFIKFTLNETVASKESNLKYSYSSVSKDAPTMEYIYNTRDKIAVNLGKYTIKSNDASSKYCVKASSLSVLGNETYLFSASLVGENGDFALESVCYKPFAEDNKVTRDYLYSKQYTAMGEILTRNIDIIKFYEEPEVPGLGSFTGNTKTRPDDFSYYNRVSDDFYKDNIVIEGNKSILKIEMYNDEVRGFSIAFNISQNGLSIAFLESGKLLVTVLTVKA